jgi:predicted nucleic acid-binding protein
LIVYLDTSAAFKLVHKEPQSKALVDWFHSLSDLKPVSSQLMRVELMGNLAAKHPSLVPAGHKLLDHIGLVAVRPQHLNAAIDLVGAGLRTLDAVHLATALSIGSELEAFVTYDQNQAEVAHQHGVKVLSPGVS